MISTILTLVSRITSSPSGASAVEQAIWERGAVNSDVQNVTLGEPDINPNKGEFFSDPKVVIPIKESRYGEGGSLVFDVPEGHNDTEAQLSKFLDAVDLSYEELSAVEDLVVPVQYTGGNVIVMWDQLADFSKGSEGNPHTEESIDAALSDE